MGEIQSSTIQILAEFSKRQPAELTSLTPIESLGLDSLDTLEAVMKIEEAFNIEIDTARFSMCDTIGDVLAEINRVSQ
jgi:acyl carrier protein